MPIPISFCPCDLHRAAFLNAGFTMATLELSPMSKIKQDMADAQKQEEMIKLRQQLADQLKKNAAAEAVVKEAEAEAVPTPKTTTKTTGGTASTKKTAVAMQYDQASVTPAPLDDLFMSIDGKAIGSVVDGTADGELIITMEGEGGEGEGDGGTSYTLAAASAAIATDKKLKAALKEFGHHGVAKYNERYLLDIQKNMMHGKLHDKHVAAIVGIKRSAIGQARQVNGKCSFPTMCAIALLIVGYKLALAAGGGSLADLDMSTIFTVKGKTMAQVIEEEGALGSAGDVTDRAPKSELAQVPLATEAHVLSLTNALDESVGTKHEGRPLCTATIKKTYSQYLAEELGEQEEGDSEGPATKKYRSMVTTDRASFDKETAGFIGNWWGQKDSLAARIKAEWKKTLRNGTGDTEEGAAATAEA